MLLLIMYVPLLALLWTMAALGVRWTRTGRRPLRHLRRDMHGRSYCVLLSGLAGMLTGSMVNLPGMPWHRAVTDRLLESDWTWWGFFAASMGVPAVVVLFLTRESVLPRSVLLPPPGEHAPGQTA